LAPGDDADRLLAGVRGETRTETSRTGGEFGFDETSTSVENGPLVHYALQEWQKAQDRLEGVAFKAIKAGLDERLVRATERNSEVFGQLLRAVIDDLALTAEQTARVPEVVARHLRALSA
jgi:hypothetical protein